MKKNKLEIKVLDEVKDEYRSLRADWCIEVKNELEDKKYQYFEDNKSHHWFVSKKIRLIRSLNYKSDLSLIALEVDDSSLQHVSNKSETISEFQSGSIVSVELNPTKFQNYSGFNSYSNKKIEEIYLLIKKANINEDESSNCSFVAYESDISKDRMYFEVVLSEEKFAKLIGSLNTSKNYSIKFHAACKGFYASNTDEVKLLMEYDELIIPANFNIVPSLVGDIEKFGILVETENEYNSNEFLYKEFFLKNINQISSSIEIIKILFIFTFILIFILMGIMLIK